ncbi:MAG: acyltransferase domain-containing protein, partial [Actinomycetia bacterium]|nr:acyltransferase domain-containing protein [Actinomycetes bacterium]
AAARLRQTSVTQPALYAVEHAMACLMRSWGLTPDLVIGHSIGEYAAAVEAGIMSWETGARLVVERGRLMDSMAPGSMLAVGLPARELENRLVSGLELAAENSSELSVVSGPTADIEAFATQLEDEGLSAQLLHTSHAFHSASMTDAATAFADIAASAELGAPQIPLVSNVTGRYLTEAEATDPGFWANQIRRPVRFAPCLTTVAEAGPAVFLELGPGRALSTFVNAHQEIEGATATPTMRHPQQDRSDQLVALEAVARLWTSGIDLDWEAVQGTAEGRRIPLPTYPFERERAWLPPQRHVLALPQFGPQTGAATGLSQREPIDRWLYAPSWRREPALDRARDEGVTVVLAPAGPAGDALNDQLGQESDLVTIRPGAGFERADGRSFIVDPSTDDDLAQVFATLSEEGIPVGRLVQAWLADPAPDPPSTGAEGGAGGGEIEDLDDLERALALGVHATLACARGLSSLSRARPIRLDLVTAGGFSVLGDEVIRPEATALRGPAKVIPLEYTGLSTRLIDMATGLSDEADRQAVLDELRTRAGTMVSDEVIALRHGQRWSPTVAVRTTTDPPPPGGPTSDGAERPTLRTGGRYLIVGGLGGVGLSIAHHLAETYQASLVLTSRRGRPVVDADTDPETCRRAELLNEIEALAADLEVVAVDAGDEAAMTALIDRIDRIEGSTDTTGSGQPLNGVVVAAGVADQMGAIHRRSRDDMAASIASKIQGSLVLERALGERDLDFVLLSSSIASVLYHNRFAQVGYVTGNSYAEAFALRGRQRGRNTFTVAWDDWLDIGMSVRAAQDFSAEFGTTVDLVDKLHSFSPADGVRLFERSLRSREPVLLVSTTDLERRITADVDVISPFLEQATGDAGEVEVVEGATTEELVSSVWSSLLGFESFASSDDFFDLGGDSLQAARMADRLSRALGVEVAVDMIFDAPVLSALAQALDTLASASPAQGSDLTSGGQSERSLEPAVLSPGQQRFLDRDSESPDHFNTSVLLQPRQSVGEARLRAALIELVGRHEALRLRLLPITGEGPRRQQAISIETAPDPLTSIDLSDQASADVSAALAQVCTEVQQSMDLEAGPIFRAVLFSLPEGEQRILVVTHHLMCDRVSLLLMIDGLDATLVDGPAPASSVTSVLDWVDALHHAGTEPAARAYVAALTSRPWDRVRPLPVDRDAGPDTNRNKTVGVVTTPVASAELMAATATSDHRPDELLLLALMRALATWSGADAALVDVLGHGRRLPLEVDVSRSVGMFLSYSPVFVEFASGASDSATLVEGLRTELAANWRFDPVRSYGLGEIGGPVRLLPRAQVLFNFVGRAIATDDNALLAAVHDERGPESDPGGKRDHPLAVKAELIDDNTYELSFVYSTTIHDDATIEHLAKLTGEALIELTTTP